MSIPQKLFKHTFHYFFFIIFILLCIFSVPTDTHAQLKIESVYPTFGLIGQDLDVNLKGAGFDENARISMSLDVGHMTAIIGSVDTPGDAWGVTVVGDKAYVADGDSGLQVIDISNSQNPQIIGSLVTPGSAWGLTVAGDTAYVADFTMGLQVIDISDPYNPQIMGSVALPSLASGVTVRGDTAYVADDESGLQVIDISDPYNPEIIGSVDTPGHAWNVTVVGDTAYVADGGGNDLQIVDISNPQNPQIIGSPGTPGSVMGVAVAGDIAYLADRNTGLQVVDISDPLDPQIIGWVDTPGFNWDVTLVGDKVYVADGGSGIQMIDISDPQNPQIIGSFNTPGDAKDVTVVGDTAYVADGNSGLQVIDISAPQVAQIIGSVTSCVARDITIVGDKAYLADAGAGLTVIDISDPQNPQIIGWAGMPGDPAHAHSVSVVGDIAYVADSFGALCVFDISDPYNPYIIGSVDTPDNAWDVTIAGDMAYVADGNSGLQVIDISDPYNPEIIGSVDTSDSEDTSLWIYGAQGVFVSGSYAYVADGNTGLQVVDINDPYNPEIIGSVDTPGDAFSVTVAGDIAYVADGFDGGLQVVDISDPSDPWIIGSVDTPDFAFQLTIVGDMAYVAGWASGFQVIDISDPENPQIIASVDMPCDTLDVTVIGQRAYVAGGDSGLVIVPIPVEISPITVNSATSLSVTLPSPLIPGNYTLRVFNETENSELFGAVSFTDDPNTLKSKAIIVAGGGPEASGAMWDETKATANKAYDALILQGFQHDSIYYISEETLNNYVDKKDPDTFLSDLSNAINTWAADASQLLIYFVDHGQEEEFILHEDNDTTITLDVDVLDDWLDTLQETMTGPVTFIYDACQSGTFISRMRPPEGKERIVITGSSYEPAYFLQDGKGSFSFQFWNRIIFNGGNLGEAFLYARDSMQSYQSARIEANWDFEGNNNEIEDISIAEDMTIQRGGHSFLGVHPYITSVSDPQTISSGTSTSATIWASGIIDGEGVQALIIPPYINPETSDIPITDLDTIDLTPDGDHTYEGVYSGFETEGTYVVVIKAKATHELYSYVSETMTEYEIYSPPMYTAVTKLSGDQNIEPDSYEVDDTFSQASIIILNDDAPQSHNIHEVGDEDWVKFYGITGEIYKIKAGNVSVFCDPVIELFDSDGTTLIAGPIDNGGAWEDESLEWTCPEEGLYFVKITNANSNFGENVKYDLKLYYPTQGVPGDLTGIVTNSLGVGIGNAVVKSSVGNCTAVTDNDGNYLMVLSSGTHTITVTASGYAANSKSGVVVMAEGSTSLDFEMVPLGSDTGGDTDIDGDNNSGNSGGGGGGAGIFGEISIDDVIGYHMDGITKDGKTIYMPVTKGFKALKGAQTHVEKFAPILANVIRRGFDSLERSAEANKGGLLYLIGTYAYPILGKIAEHYLNAVGSEQLMNNAYSDTMISVTEFNKRHQQGIAISPHVVKGQDK